MTAMPADGGPRPYRKRERELVVAVQLALDTSGFTYRKWGSVQTCKAGDWIVSRGDDTYTVDQESFARTYRRTGPGTYLKVAVVWAEPAAAAGQIATREGITHYQAGDYLVSNDERGDDRYAVSAATFEALYEPAAEP